MRLWESGTWPSKTPTGSHGNSTWRRMNPLHLAVLLAVSSQSPSMQDADARALLQLEDDWAGALIRRDATVFRRLLADGFIYTEDDRMVGRDALLRDIVAGPDTVEAAHNEAMQVHPFGSTAVVTGWLIVRGRGAGGPFDRRYRFTDTWLRRGGRWQIVAAHDYLVRTDRKSTRLNSSHLVISYAVFCLKKKTSTSGRS